MLYQGCKDLGLLCQKLKCCCSGCFLFPESIMVCVGDWQIQTIFTYTHVVYMHVMCMIVTMHAMCEDLILGNSCNTSYGIIDFEIKTI